LRNICTRERHTAATTPIGGSLHSATPAQQNQKISYGYSQVCATN
jgi:hypothetical protein